MLFYADWWGDGTGRTTGDGQQMDLPGEGVKHSTNGNAGQHTVVAPQSKVNALEGCRKSQA